MKDELMLTYDDPIEEQDASPGFGQGLRSLLYAAAAPVVLLAWRLLAPLG